jgi:tRNA 5-methylaminomethyl-2-thiouridine biosynthesis bifunctional protein
MNDTPRSEEFDDIYFAEEDGFAESQYVFLQGNNLPAAWEGRNRFTIAETGFGTGLNFLAAWKLFEETATPGQKLHYLSFEKFPLSPAQIRAYLSRWQGQLGPYLDRMLEEYPLRVSGWHTLHLTDRVTATLIFDDINRAIPELVAGVDAWFLDGHAPAKNPEMWSEAVFAAMARCSRKGATVATFTAAGFVRRALADAGFEVRKARGYGRKRDMTLGTFAREGAKDAAAATPKKVAVIGGGIAGTAAAASFARRGAEVHLFERGRIAGEGSGNPRGLYNPRFTAQMGVDSDFYSPAFANAYRIFMALQKKADIGFSPIGNLHLLTNDEKKRKIEGMAHGWGWNADHVRQVSAQDASSLAGVDLPCEAVFLPDAGMVSPPLVCRALAENAVIHETANIPTLIRRDNGWLVDGQIYDAVILASGAAVGAFAETGWLPVGTIRGQVSTFGATSLTESLKTNLCYGGYVSAAWGGRHVMGATFQNWLTDTAVREEDHAYVTKLLTDILPGWAPEIRVTGGRASLRLAAKDRQPIAGAVPDVAAWKSGAEKAVSGLYVTTAHGSHGLVSAPLCAEHIAGLAFGENPALPRAVHSFLSSERFLLRERKRWGNR